MTFTDRDLVILVPMLGRPQHVAPLLESVRETVPGARVVFLCTQGDDEVVDAILRNVGALPHGAPELFAFRPNERGDYAIKVNTGYRLTDAPLIFTGASDIRFRPGWFDVAVKHFDDPAIGVVGTNDVHSRRAKLPGNTHATHFLFRRSYVDELGTLDRPGEVMPECYIHEYVDDETVGVATMRGAYAYEPASIVEHLHPYWNVPGAEWDDTYRAMGARVGADAQLFRGRSRRWT